MKTAILSAALAVSVAAGALAGPASAQDYRGDYYYAGGGDAYACHEAKRDQATAGGIFGAIAGALLGAAVAPHHAQGGGAAVGALAGAAVGSSIGHDAARDSAECQSAREISYRRDDGYSYGYGYARPDYRYGYGRRDDGYVSRQGDDDDGYAYGDGGYGW